MIRRPLCLAALVWLAVLAAGLALGRFRPLEGYDEVKNRLDGQDVTITGRVVKITGTGEERTLYLDHIVLEQEQKLNTENTISSVTHAGEIFYAEDHGRREGSGADPAGKPGEAAGDRVRFPASCQVAIKSREGFPGICCDDRLRAEGEAVFPAVPTNPGQFDDESYCLNRDIIFRIYDGRTCVIRRDRGIRYLLQEMRSRLAAAFETCLGEEEAAVLTGITLGDSTGISQGTKDLFREGGIAHILAISGLHVNLLAMAMYGMLRKGRLPVPVCCILSLSLFFLYMLMTGMSLSCVRAFILFGVWCLAQVSGRRVDVPTSLALASSILCSIYPGLLIDGAFYLSFGCVLALFLFSSPLEALMFGKKRPPGWGRALAASLAVSLGTMPVNAWFYYRLTPWAVLVNLLVLPCMSFLFLSGCLGGLLGLLFPPAGSFVLSVCHYLLRFFMLACQTERRLPFGVVITGRPALWQIFLFYLWLAAFLWNRRFRERVQRLTGRLPRGRGGTGNVRVNGKGNSRGSSKGNSQGSSKGNSRGESSGIVRVSGRGDGKHRKDRRGGMRRKNGRGGMRRKPGRAAAAVSLMAGCVLILLIRVRPALRIAFLDVGQGDCILVQTGPDSYLVDCGSSSVDGVWGRRVSPALQYYGISRLDGVFVSHGDSDHVNGLQEWLQGYERNLMGDNCADISADAVFLSLAAVNGADGRTAAAASDEAARGLAALAEEKGLPVLYLEPGDRVGGRLSGDRAGPAADGFTCLYPSCADIGAAGGDANKSSMVLEFRKGPVRLLLTGDAEKEGEERLVKILKERAATGNSEGTADRTKTETILKVGHHGSRNATSRALLEVLRPDVAVVSCGRQNRYGHPAQVVLQRLDKSGTGVRRTDLEGAVILEKFGNSGDNDNEIAE